MHSTTLSSESLMKMYICSQTPVVSWPAREHIGVGAGTDQLYRAGRLHLKVQVHMPPLTRRNLQPFLLQTQPSVFTKTPKENPDKMIARTSKRRRSGRSVRSRNVCAVRYGFVYWIRIFFSFAENCPSNHRQAQCQHQESNRGSTVLPRAGRTSAASYVRATTGSGTAALTSHRRSRRSRGWRQFQLVRSGIRRKTCKQKSVGAEPRPAGRPSTRARRCCPWSSVAARRRFG